MFIFLLIGIMFGSCNKVQKEEGKTPVARVFDKYLYKEDLKDIVPSGLSEEDSISRVHNYIDMWAKKQALMKTAELNLAEEQKDVSQELEDYRMTLLISRYKQIFMEQNLDTIITEQQIEEYYNAHPEVFKITQPAVMALYIKILKTSPNVEVIKRKYRSAKEKDIEEVKNLCIESSAEYDDFNNEWIYFRDLTLNIPIGIDDQEKFLKTNKYIEAEDENYMYFVHIKNYRLKGATAPVKFVRGQISVGILNDRKEKLIRELENNIYNNMLDSKKIELMY